MATKMILGDMYTRNARLAPNGTAFEYDGHRTTHGEFAARINRLANALYDRGVRRQDRVAILAQNCPQYIEVYGAGEVAGYITAAVNFRLAAPEIAYILNDNQPEVLVFESQYTDIVGGLRGTLSKPERYICIGPSPDWAEDYEAVLAGGSAEAPPIRAREDDTAYLIYTSGTTGRPKGAMLGHRGQVAFAAQVAMDCGIQADDVMFLVMPFYHIGAKCNQIGCAYRGASFVLHRNYEPAAIVRALETHRVTLAHLAPVMVHDLLQLPDLASYDLSAFRLLQYASGPMPVAHIKLALEAFGPILMQIYGMTETGASTILYPYHHRLDGSETDLRRLASAGQAPPGWDIRVIRPGGTDCEIGELGEILSLSPSVMQGYWNNSAATLEALEDGWMHTGDVGYFDEEYFLFVADRKKDMIVSGGENIYPREVEEALYAHPGVAEAAVIGIPDDRWGESVRAVVATHPGASPSAEELIEHCRTLIASYKKPKSVVFIDALPRLPNQKIDKKSLREPYWANRDRQIN